MKRWEDMTFEELREAGATIDDVEIREAAYDLLSRAEKIEQKIAERIVTLLGAKYDQP